MKRRTQMTRFEQLMNKSYAGLKGAYKTKGRMAAIWARHSRELENKARRLSIEEASREVDEKGAGR